MVGFVVVVVPVLGQCSSCVVWYDDDDDDDVCRSREMPFRCVVVWMDDVYFAGLVWFGLVFVFVRGVGFEPLTIRLQTEHGDQ